MVKHFSTAKGLFRAVDGVDVDIEPSTIVALLGPSGSGKTTLLRLVAGLEQPTAGSIYFDDTDATDLSVQERQIGMVFQSYALFNHMTVAENIKFGLEVRKLNVDHGKRVQDLLALVQLQGLGDRYPRQLTGGQRQRVAMARALASNPRLLLLDEPFGALDAVVRKQLRAGLREIVRSVGVTTIIVTHDQEEAFDLADKVVVFNRGLVEQQGKPNDIIKHPRTPFIMKFVGETNVVPATSLVGRGGGAPKRAIRSAGVLEGAWLLVGPRGPGRVAGREDRRRTGAPGGPRGGAEPKQLRGLRSIRGCIWGGLHKKRLGYKAGWVRECKSLLGVQIASCLAVGKGISWLLDVSSNAGMKLRRLPALVLLPGIVQKPFSSHGVLAARCIAISIPAQSVCRRYPSAPPAARQAHALHHVEELGHVPSPRHHIA
jgi:ABC-type sulfate/molybdate transport systems ATPase subunit